jgi:hypothetical protein
VRAKSGGHYPGTGKQIGEAIDLIHLPQDRLSEKIEQPILRAQILAVVRLYTLRTGPLSDG